MPEQVLPANGQLPNVTAIVTLSGMRANLFRVGSQIQFDYPKIEG